MTFTIIGASGFIGSAVTEHLRRAGVDVLAPPRDDDAIFAAPLGHVIYAAGITADFRQRPFATLAANTTLVAQMLERAQFESFLYLSSARVYRHAHDTAEDIAIALRPDDPEDLYDFTKLTAEALCHASKRTEVRVVRLSNVVGNDFSSKNFLSELIRDAVDSGRIELRSALDSAKDYVLLEDVVEHLPKISVHGRKSCYNFGSGSNISNRSLLTPILQASGAALQVRADAPCHVAPVLDVSRLRAEFGFEATPVLPALGRLVEEYKKIRHAQD